MTTSTKYTRAPPSFLSLPFPSLYFPFLPSSTPFSSSPPPVLTPSSSTSFSYISLILFPCCLEIFGKHFKIK